MSDHAIQPERPADLRSRAASRLAGRATERGAGAGAVDALSVLHALASSPETAADALTLLHELQVHQVELDLQAQEMLESRAELESALRRQIELYDFQPFGCFTIDPGMVVQELNLTGAAMLGIERDDAYGLGLDTFFCADSARRLRSAIGGAGAGMRQAACLLDLGARGGRERSVLASIGLDPAARRFFVSLAYAGDEAGAQQALP
jgi:PAS domain-containing protein